MPKISGPMDYWSTDTAKLKAGVEAVNRKLASMAKAIKTAKPSRRHKR